MNLLCGSKDNDSNDVIFVSNCQSSDFMIKKKRKAWSFSILEIKVLFLYGKWFFSFSNF